jgi:tetratricopeptide (TPR) repeat protein
MWAEEPGNANQARIGRPANAFAMPKPLISSIFPPAVKFSALVLLLAVAPAGPGHVRELIASDRWAEALDEARAVAAAEPSDPEARSALGEALYRAGRIDEAAELLAPLSTSPSAPGRALAQLALARAAQGQDGQAAELFGRALAAAADDRWVVYWASGGADTREKTVALLNAYLAKSDGDDPDRIEGAKGTLRLYAALGERKIWVPTARPERTEIPLSPLFDPGRRNGWTIEAALANGKRVRLLLDTGSTGLFVVLRAVKKGGYTPLAEETVFAGGGRGRTPSARGLLETIAFGNLAFRDALVTTSKDEFDPQGRIHGVVGLNVFSGYRITLDLAKGRLLLDPPAGNDGGQPYWTVGGQMLVRAAAAGAPEGLFLFDTGATRSNLDNAYARAVPGAQPSTAATVSTYGGSVAGATLVRGAKLRFDGLETGGDPVHASDFTQRSRLGGVEISGFLGMDLLDGKVVVIDTTRHRLSVSRPAKN